MISLAKFKELLGNEAENMTDKEIEEIRDAQYQMAEIAFEFWRAKNPSRKDDFML